MSWRRWFGRSDSADAVYGSRIQPDGSDMRKSQPPWRRALGRTFHAARVAVGRRARSRTRNAGSRASGGDVAQDVFGRQRITSIVFDVELIYLVRRRGYRWSVLPIRWADRRGSRMHPGIPACTSRGLGPVPDPVPASRTSSGSRRRAATRRRPDRTGAMHAVRDAFSRLLPLFAIAAR